MVAFCLYGAEVQDIKALPVRSSNPEPALLPGTVLRDCCLCLVFGSTPLYLSFFTTSPHGSLPVTDRWWRQLSQARKLILGSECQHPMYLSDSVGMHLSNLASGSRCTSGGFAWQCLSFFFGAEFRVGICSFQGSPAKLGSQTKFIVPPWLLTFLLLPLCPGPEFLNWTYSCSTPRG